jgi:hypothetical protein
MVTGDKNQTSVTMVTDDGKSGRLATPEAARHRPDLLWARRGFEHLFADKRHEPQKRTALSGVRPDLRTEQPLPDLD